jgi:hypothetical protein
MKKMLLAIMIVIFSGVVFADSPPSWSEFEALSKSGKYVAQVIVDGRRIAKEPWQNKYRLEIFKKESEALLWSCQYFYDGYPEGILSDDGSVFVYVNDGTMVLKYPGFITVLGYVVIGFGLLCGIITVFHIIPTTGDEVVPYLVLFFVLLGAPLVLLGHGTRVLVTEEKVQYAGVFKKVEIRWEEIQKVTFSFTSELVLQSGTAKIKLNMMITGFEGFVDMMKRKLDPALYEKALQNWEKARNNMDRR